jgi:hypothetical protein
MLGWIKKAAIKMVWPKVKEYVIKQINSEEYQELVVNKAEGRIPDTKGLSKKQQVKLLNTIYDIGQESAIELIESIDIEKALEKLDNK